MSLLRSAGAQKKLGADVVVCYPENSGQGSKTILKTFGLSFSVMA